MKKLHNRTKLNTFLLAFAAATTILSPCFVDQLQAVERPSKPNIIIMMADDMGIGDPANADRLTTLRDVVAEHATKAGKPDSVRLGSLFRKYKKRVVGGYRLTGIPGRSSTMKWTVVEESNDARRSPTTGTPCSQTPPSSNGSEIVI